MSAIIFAALPCATFFFAVGLGSLGRRVRAGERCGDGLVSASRSALLSLGSLVAIAVSKTLLTKHIFDHLPAPVALSCLSCAVTALLLVPPLCHQGTLRPLVPKELSMFSLVCLAVAADLAYTNVGLSLLPIALHQSLKATLPAVTIAVEVCVRRRCAPLGVVAAVVGLCIGPVVLSYGRDDSSARSVHHTPVQAEYGSGAPSGGGLVSSTSNIAWGLLAMVVAVVSGAFKFVLAHDAIRKYKTSMGVLGFTFWLEIVSIGFLAPWALANGEMRLLWERITTSSSPQQSLLLLGTAAFGGVRILAQFFFLEQTSPTTLAATNVVIQVLVIGVGTAIFADTPVDSAFVVGTTLTVAFSTLYLCLKHLKAHRVVMPLAQCDPANVEDRLIPTKKMSPPIPLLKL